MDRNVLTIENYTENIVENYYYDDIWILYADIN
jgi:hypothetical protein